MSAATLPPWLAPWSSVVYGQRAMAAPERYRPRPRLTIYTLGHGDNTPILRFNSWAEEGSGSGLRAGVVPVGHGELGDPGVPGEEGSAPPPAVRWERVPLDREPWHVDVPVPVQPRLRDRPPPFDHDMEFGGGGGGGTEEALHAWGGVLRGWAAGAALLALLVVLVRVGERLLDWKIVLRRRRLFREWQRANVSATARLDGPPPLSTEIRSQCCIVEMPPPYSACGPAETAAGAVGGTGGARGLPKDEQEEPPPPYSDVVTQYFGKNGQPLFVYNRDPPRVAPAPAPTPAPAPALAPALSDYDSDDSPQHTIARILRAYGVDCPIGSILAELPLPDDHDTRLFRHVYRAFAGRNDDIDNDEPAGDIAAQGTEDVEAPDDLVDAPTDADADPTDAAAPDASGDDPNDGSVVV